MQKMIKPKHIDYTLKGRTITINKVVMHETKKNLITGLPYAKLYVPNEGDGS